MRTQEIPNATTEAAPAAVDNPACRGVLMIAGEHFACDWPVDENGKHDGWAHANKQAGAIWAGPEVSVS